MICLALLTMVTTDVDSYVLRPGKRSLSLLARKKIGVVLFLRLHRRKLHLIEEAFITRRMLPYIKEDLKYVLEQESKEELNDCTKQNSGEDCARKQDRKGFQKGAKLQGKTFPRHFREHEANEVLTDTLRKQGKRSLKEILKQKEQISNRDGLEQEDNPLRYRDVDKRKNVSTARLFQKSQEDLNVANHGMDLLTESLKNLDQEQTNARSKQQSKDDFTDGSTTHYKQSLSENRKQQCMDRLRESPKQQPSKTIKDIVRKTKAKKVGSARNLSKDSSDKVLYLSLDKLEN